MNPRTLLSLLLASGLLAACQSTPPAAESTARQNSHVESALNKAEPTTKYLAPNAIDLRALLPDPPAPNSPYSDGEIGLIRATQADASPESRARAIAEDNMKVWLFAEILGPEFTAADKPRTTAFIKQIERDSSTFTSAAKKIWNRPRPFDQSPDIKILIEKPTSGSYPSGHTTRAAIWSETLALLAPDKADAIRARARLIGLDRIILGVHFPSDVAAGNALGKAIVDKMTESPAFQHDLAQARAEWTR
ncbi:MAG: phosphatase PAP2 family protein [Phycisphaerae bacterium]|nr:phosphatase PAP2 family protein [Phycisphaerae bacterium]